MRFITFVFLIAGSSFPAYAQARFSLSQMRTERKTIAPAGAPSRSRSSHSASSAATVNISACKTLLGQCYSKVCDEITCDSKMLSGDLVAGAQRSSSPTCQAALDECGTTLAAQEAESFKRTYGPKSGSQGNVVAVDKTDEISLEERQANALMLLNLGLSVGPKIFNGIDEFFGVKKKDAKTTDTPAGTNTGTTPVYSAPLPSGPQLRQQDPAPTLGNRPTL